MVGTDERQVLRHTSGPFGNADGVVEITSSQTPAVGNVCGDLFAVVTGAAVGQEAETDTALGRPFTIVVNDAGLRREYTVTAEDGRTATVTNGTKFDGFVEER